MSGHEADDRLLAPFRSGGGVLLASPDALRERLSRIRALLFDWDGVFNSGVKGAAAPSGFSEADSMGTNLLRFSLWLRDDERMPFTGILTGQHNPSGVGLAERERFQAVYRGFLDKLEALQDVERRFGIEPSEICFVFDDVLDLAVARRCGLRVLVRNGAAPLLARHAAESGLCDYVTGREGGAHAVRETAELLLGLAGSYERVVSERSAFSESYRRYLAARNLDSPQILTPGEI